MGMYGPGSVGQILMVAPGVGYCTTSVTYSPSSGSGQSYWFTENEWGDHALLGSSANRSLRELKARGTRALFSSWYNQLSRLNSLLRWPDGSGQWYAYPFYSYTPTAIAPIGDTVCLVSTYTDAGSVILRMTPTETVVLDTLTSDWTRGVAMVFHDTLTGALLLHGNVPGSAILVTHDGGSSWTPAWSDTLRRVRAMAWSSDQTLWAVGNAGLVVGTHDGGVTWSEVILPTDSDLVALATCGEDSIWIGGSGGVILATGNPFVSWTDRSRPGFAVKDLFAFEGVVYATNGSVLYKLPIFDNGLLRAGTGSWWSYVQDGIQLRLEEDEILLGAALYDDRGRAVDVTTRVGRMILRGLPGGLYILELSTNKRTERGKVLWLPLDP